MKQEKSKFYRIPVAAILGFMLTGLSGCGMDAAETEKWFADLQGAGVFVSENAEKEIYEVQIDPPMMEKDGVKVELKNFYAKNKRFYGTVYISGDALAVLEEGASRDDFDVLKEQRKITWHYGDKQREMIDGQKSATANTDDYGVRSIKKYEVECEEYLYLEDKGIDTYHLQVNGFDEKFTLKVTEAKWITAADKLGYTQALNGNTVIARAMMDEEHIVFEHYDILTDEVKMLEDGRENFEFTKIPNDYEKGSAKQIRNKNGEELKLFNGERIENGYRYLVNGSEDEFPLTFYYSGFSGTNGEEEMLRLPIPDAGEKRTEDLPRVEFDYGTVEILSVERTADGKLMEFNYDIIPKEDARQMYAVRMKIPDAFHDLDGGNIFWENEIKRESVQVVISNSDTDYKEILLYNPSYWIKGEYNITIVRPMEG